MPDELHHHCDIFYCSVTFETSPCLLPEEHSKHFGDRETPFNLGQAQGRLGMTDFSFMESVPFILS